MKTTVIDGNNLIHKIEKLKENFLKEKDNVQCLLADKVYSRIAKSEKFIFVFDGFGKTKRDNIIFSQNSTADEVIRKIIEDFKDHKKLKIVSSDNYITDFAKVCGCEVQNPEAFWSELIERNSPAAGKNINQNYIYDKLEKPERMSRKEMDEFKKYFS